MGSRLNGLRLKGFSNPLKLKGPWNQAQKGPRDWATPERKNWSEKRKELRNPKDKGLSKKGAMGLRSKGTKGSHNPKKKHWDWGSQGTEVRRGKGLSNPKTKGITSKGAKGFNSRWVRDRGIPKLRDGDWNVRGIKQSQNKGPILKKSRNWVQKEARGWAIPNPRNSPQREWAQRDPGTGNTETSGNLRTATFQISLLSHLSALGWSLLHQIPPYPSSMIPTHSRCVEDRKVGHDGQTRSSGRFHGHGEKAKPGTP